MKIPSTHHRCKNCDNDVVILSEEGGHRTDPGVLFRSLGSSLLINEREGMRDEMRGVFLF